MAKRTFPSSAMVCRTKKLKATHFLNLQLRLIAGDHLRSNSFELTASLPLTSPGCIVSINDHILNRVELVESYVRLDLMLRRKCNARRHLLRNAI